MNRQLLSARQPYLVIAEREPVGGGRQTDTLTIFLTAAQCPVNCHMCDLWQNTLTTPTPTGAIADQIDVALAGRSRTGWIKLYNSGNFFDPHSIPPVDYTAIADRCDGFDRVVVENHPRFGRRRLQQFRDLLSAPLEVAVGLETVQPRWLGRLGKQMSRDDFDRYARWLRQQGVDLRVFLIVGVPGGGVAEALRWARLSVRHAIACGARHVSLIPARSGHGWNGRAHELPQLTADHLLELLATTIGDADQRATVTVDLWDLATDDPAIDRLQQWNLNQRGAES